MKTHSTSPRVGRSPVKLDSLNSGSPGCEPEDERTMKFATPRKSKQCDRLTAEDQDSEKTVSFSKQLGKKLVSRSETSRNGTPRKQPKFDSSSANEHLMFNSQTLCMEAPKPKQELCRTHTRIVEILKKVDSYLLFLRSNRSKNSDLFKSIQKNLLDNYGMMIEIESIWKILFLMPKAYNCTRDKGNFTDARLSLPLGSVDLVKRIQDLKAAIIEYIEKAKKTKQSQSTTPTKTEADEEFIDIPCASLEDLKLCLHSDGPKRPAPVDTATLEAESKANEPDIKTQSKNRSIEASTDPNTINPYSILDSSKREEFRQKLLAIVRQKEKKINEEKERVAALGANAKRSYLKVDDYKYFIESLTLLYIQRHVNNMFVASVINEMSRKINYSTTETAEMLKRLQEKGQGYLRTLKTVRGDIIQMDKSKSNATIELVTKEGFL